jgi:hypothetical protein
MAFFAAVKFLLYRKEARRLYTSVLDKFDPNGRRGMTVGYNVFCTARLKTAFKTGDAASN